MSDYGYGSAQGNQQGGGLPPGGPGFGLFGFVEILQLISNIQQTLNSLVNVLAPPLKGSGSANATNTTSTQVVAASTGNRLYGTAYTLMNDGATGVGVLFQDGSGGATIWADYVGAGSAKSFSTADERIPLFGTSSGNALYFAATGSTTTLYVSVAGIAGP